MPYSCLPGYDKNNDGSHKVGTYVVYFKVRQKEDMPKLYAEVNELVRKYNTSQKEYTVDISSTGSVLADMVQRGQYERD